jgi:hypothetical protein
MNYMQKRRAWNRGTSRIKTVRGKYDFYKGSRWAPVAGLLGSMVLCLWLQFFGQSYNLYKMQQDVEASEYKKPMVIDTRDTNISTLIEDAVNEFLPNHKSESLMIMHCLAHRESGHGASNAHGDGGLAGGPLQFHQETWQRMRGQMIKQGVADEIGSRYDLKEAVRTTAWAIREGRGLEWGPILRDSKGSDFASCQKPSWY